jgi:hypothetical protein
VATGRSILLIESKIEVLDLVDFPLPPPGLDFHPGEPIERAHGDVMRFFGFSKDVRLSSG